jgi:diguanylate cyclase (GGDEF)-like protein
MMQKHSRDADTVARLGGDEFVLLLPETGTEDAAIAAKKLHTHLTEEVQRRRWPVSFSLGLLTCLHAPPSVDDLLKSADQLTYMVKEHGKNGIKQAVANTQPAAAETLAVQAPRGVMHAVPSA